MQASSFPPQRLALPGYHYRSNGRFCALPDPACLGGTAIVEYRVAGHWSVPHRLLDADICGTPGRVDLPIGLWRSICPRSHWKDGLFPIRILHVTRARHHQGHDKKRRHVTTRIGQAWRGDYHK